MNLNDLRGKIDKIDDELIRLFEQRMDVSAEIAGFKKQKNIAVYDPARERLAHSFTPFIHAELSDYEYGAYSVDKAVHIALISDREVVISPGG